VAIDRTLASWAVRLGEQWSEILEALPRDWERIVVDFRVPDDEQRERASLLLGRNPDGETFRLELERDAETVGLSPEVMTKLLARLTDEGVTGELQLAKTHTGRHSLAEEWDVLVDALPPDWSHLLAQVDLDSSDFVDRAALRTGPMNPLLVGLRSLQFRCARTVGYGVSPGMARRCLERLDDESITGRVSIVHVVSDAHPVATQGPVFRLGGKPV
jgi:hypothetical protein